MRAQAKLFDVLEKMAQEEGLGTFRKLLSPDGDVVQRSDTLRGLEMEYGEQLDVVFV